MAPLTTILTDLDIALEVYEKTSTTMSKEEFFEWWGSWWKERRYLRHLLNAYEAAPSSHKAALSALLTDYAEDAVRSLR